MTAAEPTITARSEGMEMAPLPGNVAENRSRVPTTIASSAMLENMTQEISDHSGSFFAGKGRPTGVKFWLLMLNLGAVLILISIDMNIVATAVPAITDHFHSVADVGWYSSAFRLCQCAFQFVFGKAYRLFSIKRVFLLANVISIAGSLLCGVASTSTMLIIGRAVAGLGAAGLLSGCFIILVQSTDPRRRPMYTGVMGAVEGLATLSAPILGGAIVQSLGWRWCFYINGPIGVVAIVLTMFCFSDTPKPGDIARLKLKQKISQLDLVSNMLFIPALTGLFLALSWAGTKYPWNSGPVIGPLVSFICLTAAFIYNQKRRGDEAALPLRIMKHRSIIAGFIFIMCVNSTGSVLEYYLPTYYQVVRGYTPAKSGYMMLPIVIAGTIGSLVHGFGTSIFGYYAPFMVFASTMMPIAAGLITTVKINTSFAQLIIYTGFSGLAYGIGFSGPQNAVQTVLAIEDVPLGTSIMLFAQSFGPTVAVAVAQVLFVNQLSTNLNVLMPGIDEADLGKSSLNHIVTSVPLDKSRDVLVAIDKSLIQTWYLVVGLACTTMIGSLMIEWRSVKSRRD
ncbi:efflux pump antibiotic resistance protein [Penicillium cosmopolitanum]|uniref:Efflux pump antibiotic resistance protein n=1 Tax=Penicillium cosmopolitanum TaxID=1131564 RepID=A0A9W9SKV9_9EURO|nr:efflux pump antibiotic resistance protein [Penicillium cosmopolitanum]KAJ5379129.1 efflux pump antibiotic resistance protein [Penicillium cosmopolitanum]